ncbi:sensor domain-containing diguanylate cyclase [Paraburkholderia heleia]|uniref:sensor domain-containing diguanylate cyclase n=1 Tax=Paraburkholderia heleia TaxID=634127 RepID=UPI001427D2E1|nr:sensor domain-containing diguanylate cyclase [Paraburkholderia heleia]
MPKLDLRRLIVGLTLLTAFGTLANSLLAARHVQRDVLIRNALDSNRAYAAKVASGIDGFLRDAQRRLAYSSGLLADNFGDAVLRHAEAERLQAQDMAFNSVAIVDEYGRVMDAVPETLELGGSLVTSPGAKQALAVRQPLVSQAIHSTIGNLIVLVSFPIISQRKKYLGFVGGSIYLHEAGVLHTLIARHFYRNEARVYIFDANRRLLYAPDRTRLGTKLGRNEVVDDVLTGESGAMIISNSEGIEMVSGFASIPASNWGVVVELPLDAAIAPLDELVFKTLLSSAPIGFLGLVAIWWFSSRITRPLKALAENSNAAPSAALLERVRDIDAWYFEAENIKHALLAGIAHTQDTLNRLSIAAQTDPLTDLFNRRALDDVLRLLEAKAQSFSVLAIDIDHFKSINDAHGHDVGDVALIRLGGLIRESLRHDDIACRVGGEEFLVILPGTSIKAARAIAERLRQCVEQASTAPFGKLTISVGVTIWPLDSATPSDALKEADRLMYLAKQRGRNRIESTSHVDHRADLDTSG